MDGRNVCKTIKEDKRTKHIPIILITASHDVATSSKEGGADDFFPKPFEMDELLEKVAKYIWKLKGDIKKEICYSEIESVFMI